MPPNDAESLDDFRYFEKQIFPGYLKDRMKSRGIQ